MRAETRPAASLVASAMAAGFRRSARAASASQLLSRAMGSDAGGAGSRVTEVAKFSRRHQRSGCHEVWLQAFAGRQPPAFVSGGHREVGVSAMSLEKL